MYGLMSAPNPEFRRIILTGEISDELYHGFMENMTLLEQISVTEPITVYLNTQGGSVISGLAIYDAIKISPCPIYTVGLGKVMSMGTLILASGDQGHRYVSDNVRIMIHHGSGGALGTIKEIENSVKELQYMNDKYFDLLSQETGKTKAQILKDIKDVDCYMSAQEAIDYGIVDAHIPKTKAPKKKSRSRKSTAKRTTKKKAPAKND